MRSLREIAQGAKDYGLGHLRTANADVRAVLLRNEYRVRRRHYEERARSLGVHYSGEAVLDRTQVQLRRKGLAPAGRVRGNVHTLAFFPLNGWHHQLLKPLSALGHLSHFDSRFVGISYSELLSASPAAIDLRRRICESFERYARRVVKEQAVDWIFTYATGAELLVDTVDRVRDITKAPVVGMCFDDRQSWSGPMIGDQYAGQISLASHLDLAWTSARVACDWYLVEGGNPIYLPEGCDPDLYCPNESEQDIDVCFVGQAYGFRKDFISGVRNLGLGIQAAGSGWPGGAISDEALVALLRRSKVVLGLGGIGWCEDLKNTKGRDFDGPSLGMAPYLTSFNPELTDFFDIGREILCFSSADECYEVASRLLSDEPLRLSIAQAGRKRCLREHTWAHRFERVLTMLGILRS